MRFEFKSSFDRSVKKFSGREKEDLKRTAIEAIDILSQDKDIHKGIGSNSGDTILNSLQLSNVSPE